MDKKVKQIQIPKGKHVVQTNDPNKFYKEKPAWRFNSCDDQCWSFSSERIGDVFWSEILPFFKKVETKTWDEIFIREKKRNHSIRVTSLNATAKKRIEEQHLELDSIHSLRITGNHRLYGYMQGHVFHILWYDDDHGDNEDCVCRSYKKNT